ncbi:ribosomal RNA small subunit methyltransferase A [Candidatus Nomurabacteria bacterium]|nr:ribosomal RNA small subunit methyltransferase A [Candidatus Nomurabacteria bacterium]
MQEKFAHKKSLGQNFLNSDYVPIKMCDAANLQAGETVLEIGPGTGALTKEILKRDARVIAIEADARAVTSLEESFSNEIASGQLTLHHHDARSLNLADFGLTNQTFKVVSNIPYYLSGFLFRTLLDSKCQPNTLVFLIQKEVAERIARDKKESLLSLSVKVFGEPTYICTVSKSHFTPPPKIDSAIVAVNKINRDIFSNFTSKQFFHILHLGFAQKRKQLVGNLAKEFPRETVSEILTRLALPLDVRAEDIPLDTWINVVNSLLTVKTI